MADKVERDKRLEALQKATIKWADTRTAQYTRQIAVCKALLQGRTGAERLVHTNVRVCSDLVVNSLDEFLLF